MDHLHFVTEIDLTKREKEYCFEMHVYRLAQMHHRRKGTGRLADEILRLRHYFLQSRDFHMIPVNEAEILGHRRTRSAS